jgi:hypothetical protein
MNPYNKPSPQAYLVHHGIKGQKWGVRRYQNEDGSLTVAGKKRQQRIENAEKHALASRAVGSAKLAAASGAASLGIALVGSAATKMLAQKGQTQAAQTIYDLSKRAFNETVFATQIFAGSAVVQGLMTSKNSIRDYLAEERRIRKR